MRILRLDVGDTRSPVEMHPLITVVHGLGGEHRESLLQHVRSLARGSAVGVHGLIEDQAKLLSLEGEGTIALSHVTTVDVVVDADNTVSRSAAAESLQAEIDQLQRQADIDAALVEETRALLDPTVKSRLAQLRLEIRSLMDGRNPEVQRRQKVQKALQAAQQFEHYESHTPPQVDEAIQAWDLYQDFLRTHQQHAEELSTSLNTLEGQVVETEAELLAAEADAVPVLLDSQQESRLFELEEARDGKGWKEDSPQAAELRSLLSLVGVSSWTAYSMYRLSPTVAPEKLALVADLKRSLAGYQQQITIKKNEMSADPVVKQLEALRSDAQEKAYDQLGASLPEDVGTSLRQKQVLQVNQEWLQAHKDLLAMLQTPGVGAPDTVNIESCEGWAQMWLTKQEQDGSPQRGPETIRREIVEAEKVLGQHNRAMEQMDRLEHRSSESREQIRKIFLAREAAVASGSHHTAELLAFIRTVTEEALWEASSAIPVAITGELGDIDVPELMSSLELLAQRIQIIVVSENAEIAEWARSAGPKRALLTMPKDEKVAPQ